MSSEWRMAESLEDLLDELNAMYPNREKLSDGGIGDAAHRKRGSDHNPWVVDYSGCGVVRARDFDKDGIDANKFAEQIRKLGAAGDRRLNPNGYVIWNAKIASADRGWVWRRYQGKNLHRSHVHVSVTTSPSGYDRLGTWLMPVPSEKPRVVQPNLPGHKHHIPSLRIHQENTKALEDATKDLQGHLALWRKNRGLSVIPRDGQFGNVTYIALQTFQRSYGLTPDGRCGPEDWAMLHRVSKGSRVWP